MTCQYCHSKDHDINNCPVIICRICRKIGHPKWLCKNKELKQTKTKKFTEKNIPYYLKIESLKWSDINNNNFEV